MEKTIYTTAACSGLSGRHPAMQYEKQRRLWLESSRTALVYVVIVKRPLKITDSVLYIFLELISNCSLKL